MRYDDESEVCLPKGIDGYVYLISSTNGLFKIGCSRRPYKRLEKLQTKHRPHRLKLEHVILSSNMKMGESAFHRHFAYRLIAGEWFALNRRDVALFLRVRQMVSYPAPSVSPTTLSVRLLDGRACLPSQWAGMVDESKDLTGFRLTCVSCRMPARLTITRDYDKYDPQFAPLDIEIHCPRCEKVANVGLPSHFDDWDRDGQAIPFQGHLFANIGRYSCTDVASIIVENDRLCPNSLSCTKSLASVRNL